MSAAKDDFLYLVSKITDAYRRNDGASLRRWKAAVEMDRPVHGVSSSTSKPDLTEKVERDLKRFDEFQDRESLKAYLEKEYESKAQLTPLLRALRIPVMKSQTNDSMIERVIDATVGFRLRSAAVRGVTR